MFRLGVRSAVKCPCSNSMPITEEQLKAWLWKADANGDGRLSKEELEHAFRQLGAAFPRWRAWRAIRHADKNGDGHVSQEEFSRLVDYARKQNYENPGSCTANNKYRF